MNGKVIGILVTVMVVVTAITVLAIYFTVKSILKPINSAMKNFDRIVMNLGGEGDYTDGMVPIDTGIGIEMQQFATANNNMNSYLREQRRKQHDAQYEANPYYLGKNEFIVPSAEQSLYPAGSVIADMQVIPLQPGTVATAI